MWAKRFGVWVRSREHGVARSAEQISQEAWEEARERAWQAMEEERREEEERRAGARGEMAGAREG